MAQAVFVQAGEEIDHTPASDIAPGDVVVQGDLIGIAKQEIKAGTSGALAVTGVFDVTKASGAAVTFSTGAQVYWDDAAKLAVTTDGAGANKLFGKATAAADDADEVVHVRLSQ